VRDVEGVRLMFALGLKEKGVTLHLNKIFFFVVVPTPATAFYLHLLAGLVRTFESADARKTLPECEAPEQMWKTETKLTLETVP
jgi:mannitol/fructose-specific phosphotransferase system IIA component (Ntr-type)